MADNKTKIQAPTSFCGTQNTYPVFADECVFLQKRRAQMNDTKKALPLNHRPTAKNNLVGLCLSGGGIRSATFNLGFLQALHKYKLLQRVDYLSTVSGGGYIGSCLTALLNSEPKDEEKAKIMQKLPKCYFWKDHFPFALPDHGKDQGRQCHSGSAEKGPVRHLRYFSNYLTAEGGPIQKYLGPVLAFTRGLLFNLLLILPFMILAAAGLTAYYQMPEVTMGPLQLNSSMNGLRTALGDRRTAEEELQAFVYEQTHQLHLLDLDERVVVMEQDPQFLIELKRLRQRIESADDKVHGQWRAMLTLPLAALMVMMIAAYFFLIIMDTNLKSRFGFSRFFSKVLFVSLSVFAVQAFGAAIVYWNHYEIPDRLAFISLLTFLGPRLLKTSDTASKKAQKPWVKIVVSIVFMALTPLILLYFTGWCVTLFQGGSTLIFDSFRWTNLLWGLIAGGMLLAFTNRWLNVNKISLHNFYRDRLSRAFLIQADKSPFDADHPFERVERNDAIKLSELYGNDHCVGPYHIINTNLNLTKTAPKNSHHEAVFRKGESFIFSKCWCGSEITGYMRTRDYEHTDTHLDLGTAMAISGAAANIGMGQGDLPTLRLLMGLMNIRLGYWALNPQAYKSWESMRMLRKSPGAIAAMCEWLGLYPLKGKFINLSDGGHFDNIGVYELLRRRCKYIIVADAEADQFMKFQALSYLIRLARIDFGIDIDIDISSLKLKSEDRLSGQHCVMGTIAYPPLGTDGAETGYLFYCKSSLTGDEPPHLNEYRVKHPSFPHQTTADQWFDEQQFEAYRELGYHIGKEGMNAVEEIEAKTSLEDLFIRLKEFWCPRSVSIEQQFTRHTAELNRIIAEIKKDAHLAFMDAQIYPEWEKLMAMSKNPPRLDMWLPRDADERRAGFYICSQMIQLMENVYLDLNLEEQLDHPDNRGWKNLFMHWAWSGMFRVTWAISACTYGAKFQRFCERRLKLGQSQRISARNLGRAVRVGDDWKEAQELKRPEPLSEKELTGVVQHFLNPYEITKVKKHMERPYEKAKPSNTTNGGIKRNCYGFNLQVWNPLNEKEKIDFCFGFAFTTNTNGTVYIDYFRIQDHLRQMGLGRLAMAGLLKEIRAEQDNVLPPVQLASWTKDQPELQEEKTKLENLLDSVLTEMAHA